MSSIKLTADSGGGTFEIKGPSSSSNTRVLNIPDLADGTLVTNQSTLDATKLSGNLPALNGSALTNISAGKVLQVINNSSNTNVTTSGNTVSDLLTTAITPSSSSNKVLVFLTANTWVGNGGINAFGGLRLYRGANSSGTQIYDMEGGLNATTSHWQVFYFNYLDSPNTTSAQSYTMSIRRYSSHTTSVATDGKYYQMTLMEIAA